jgi:hypothetical protein
MSNLPHRKKTEAFSLVELLITAAIGALLIAAAVVGFAVITQSPVRQVTQNISVAGATMQALYGDSSPLITLGANPNYFQAAQARRLKQLLLDDVASASAVFCLGRDVNGSPELRLQSLPAAVDLRTNASPARFRDFLADKGVGSAFSANQSGALRTKNASIFVVGSLAESTTNANNTLSFIATYEIDFVPTSDPPGGTLATVRRYSGSNNAVPTDYYHAFYPDEDNASSGFRPLAAFFERGAPDSGDPFVLEDSNNPFTFVWWPDPLVSKLSAGAVPAASVDSARANYANMAERTSLFFVLPAFPSL